MPRLAEPTTGGPKAAMPDASAAADEVAVGHVPDQVHRNTRHNRGEKAVPAEHDDLSEIEQQVGHELSADDCQ